MNIKWVGSPNYDKNRKPIDRIVIHWFGAGRIEAVDTVFQNKERGTSAHYAIENTTVHQYVKEEHVAYHAGNYAMNQRSVGIEHSATPERSATETTYKTSARLVAEISVRYNIPLDRTHIIGHKEVKATQCPGTIDIDRIIHLAKELTNDNMSDLDECLKQHAQLVDETLTLKKEIETLRNTLGGKDSAITTAQRERDEARQEASNAKEEISRLRDQVLNLEGSVQGLTVSVKKLREENDRQGRVVGGLKADLAERDTTIRELQKGVASNLPSGSLLLLFVKSLFR